MRKVAEAWAQIPSKRAPPRKNDVKNFFKLSDTGDRPCAEDLPNQGIALKASLLPVPVTDSPGKPLVHFRGRRLDERLAADPSCLRSIASNREPVVEPCDL